MKLGNKIWNIALILLVIAILMTDSVRAGILDTITTNASNFWQSADDYVLSGVFWINLAIVFGLLFVLIQFLDRIKSRFEKKELIMYLLLFILAIIISISLGTSPIYDNSAIKWLFHVNIIINVVVVFLILQLIMLYLPQSITAPLRGQTGQDGQGGQGSNLFNYLIPLIIALIIVHNAAGVNNGVPSNTNLIWNTGFWSNVERALFGDRVSGQFGNWQGTYTDSAGNQRYGFLYWRPVTQLGGNSIRLGGTDYTPPPVPPILIFILAWLLIKLSFDRMRIFDTIAQEVQQEAQTRSTLNDNIKRILYIYLAISLTSNGLTLSTLLLYIRIYLFFIFFHALRGYQFLTNVTRFALPYILSGLLIELVVRHGAQPNMGWLMALFGFEVIASVIVPFIIASINAIGGFIRAAGPLLAALIAAGGFAWLWIGIPALIPIGVLIDFFTGGHVIGWFVGRIVAASREVGEGIIDEISRHGAGISTAPTAQGNEIISKLGGTVAGPFIIYILIVLLMATKLVSGLGFTGTPLNYAIYGGLLALPLAFFYFRDRLLNVLQLFGKKFGRDSENDIAHKNKTKKELEKEAQNKELLALIKNRINNGMAFDTYIRALEIHNNKTPRKRKIVELTTKLGGNISINNQGYQKYWLQQREIRKINLNTQKTTDVNRNNPNISSQKMVNKKNLKTPFRVGGK